MSNARAVVVLLFLVLLSDSIAAEEERHRVKDLKITIISTMMTQIGIGEWGFAALVEADGHRILFDTGFRPDTVLLNAKSMGLDLSNVEEVVLSHNHPDHTGGLVRLRQELAAENERALGTAHVAEGIFWERPEMRPEWSVAPRKDAFEASGGTFIQHEEAAEIYPGVWLTGPVPRQHPEKNYGFWVGGEHKVGKLISPDGPTDDNVPESMSMVISTDKGLVVISGCGHAGLINILDYAVELTGSDQVHAVLGGFHLLHASDATLDWTSKHLVRLGVDTLVGAHCTGLEPVYRFRDLAGFDRSSAVVGATGASFTLEDGIEPLSLAR